MSDGKTKYKDESQEEIAARSALAKRELKGQTSFGFFGRRAAAAQEKRFSPYTVQTCVDLGNFTLDYS